ncbi:hypothetical protein HRI_004771200 [Hibiscus trionum]|uniref:FLZ-type domain-containing protein n=1 Tax=Hibiscus trionum TaxID=183268 RepID=A0A9W7MTL8_HIBTR|nr:hypothetical protein HRI_004771200 [Hibiscus trionum]
MEAGCSGRSHCQNQKQRTGFFSMFLCYTRNSGGDSGSRKNLSSPVSSRSYGGRYEDRRQPHFLKACCLCQKPLGGNNDIFMYRGDTPFCSEECRYKQIVMDEVNEKRFKLSATLKALHTETAVAA